MNKQMSLTRRDFAIDAARYASAAGRVHLFLDCTQATRQRQMEEPGVEYIGIAPADQHRVLLRRQFGASPSGEFGFRCRCAKAIKLFNARIGQRLQRRTWPGFP